MNESRASAAAVGLGVATFLHALVTWPLPAAVVFFGGGVLVAFAAEAVAVNLDWLDHHVGPQTVGVPLYLLFAWPGTVYVAFRVALLATGGPTAVAVAGLLATAYDALTDHRGVSDGLWSYTDTLPGPRPRGVPWWNFAGWFVISCLTAGLALPFVG